MIMLANNISMKCNPAVIAILFTCFIAIVTPPTANSQTPEEHEQHHPKQSPVDTGSSAAMAPNLNKKDSGKGMSGMGSGMGDMMKSMGKPPEKPLYPSMMQLPDMSPEKLREIKQLANEQVAEGNALLSMGLKQLTSATRNQDITAMREATEQIRRGKILLQNGLEGQRAIAENKDPRITALNWFRHEMNLPSSEVPPQHGLLGLSWFHFITMFMLFAFAAVMIWMYFYKMQRANALMTRLAGNGAGNIALPGAAKPAAKDELPAKPIAANAALQGINPEIAPSKPNSWTGTLLVAQIFDETPNVKTYRLTDPAGGKLPFNYLPGQFVTVTVVPKGVPVRRSYTIASSPTHRDYCEITIKHEEKGTVSHFLHTQTHEGELLQLTGPSGKFTFTEEHADSAVFIGGGVGVTPMMSAVRYLTDRSWKGEIYFFFTCKNESSIIFREEILYLQKRHPNLHVFFVLSQQQGEPACAYIPGHITKEILSEHVPDIVSRMIHICGPKSMMDAVKVMLDELKVPKEKVMEEAFAGPPPAAKPLPPGAEQTAISAEVKGITAVATFAKSNKTTVLTPDKSVLEASEEAGVNIDYSCRVGTCGICKVKLLSGKVTMAVEDALTEDDKAQNIILACQAKATEDVSVDA